MMNDETFAAFAQNHETLKRFGERYRADAALRERIAAGDHSDLSVEVLEGVEVRVLEQTPETHYFLMPQDPNAQIQDQALESVVGGSSPPLSSAACAGSVGSIPSTISSLGCAGSISSVEV